MTFEEIVNLPRVFVDTQVFTLFEFLEKPDDFLPEGVDIARFILCSPILRELERIKDEHFSKSQRERAKKSIELLEDGGLLGKKLTERSYLAFYYPEKGEQARQIFGATGDSPDERFVAVVIENQSYSGGVPFFVLSDDIGVRVRVSGKWPNEQVKAYRPPETLKYKAEEYNLPQLIKQVIRDLAKEIAEHVRNVEAEKDTNK